jgi:type VI secretion system protein ImpC
MADTFSLKDSDLNLVASMEETSENPAPDSAFRILLLGDWSGRSTTPSESFSQEHSRRPVFIDRDNFDDVMRRMNLRLDLGSEINLEFAELDDFHPDRIFERVVAFERLRDVRRRLSNERTYAEAAAEVRAWMGTEATGAKESEKTESDQRAIQHDGASLLSQLIGGTPDERPTPATASRSVSGLEDVDALVREIARPHIVEREDPQQAELIEMVDRSSAGLMRTVLRDERVRALESGWRALYFLVSRLETSNALKLYLLDVSKDELGDDLAREDLTQSNLYKLLVEETIESPGGEPWSLAAANYTFDATREDAEMLASIAQVAQAARAPFVAAASSRLINCESLAATPAPEDWKRIIDDETRKMWGALRMLPEAKYIGLALPRFLLRLPYGERTEPIEAFDFEEIGESQTHEAFLWGNPSFAVAYLIGQTFAEGGWDFSSGTLQDIEGLPLYVTEEAGESVTLPCAEALLTVRAAEKILDKGLMPLLSFRDQDRVRLARLQSIAHPFALLAGRWETDK